MSLSLVLLTLLCASAVAYANGANDVSKGVATLVGAGAATYRRALRFGTAATAAGSLVALILSAGLVRTFSTALVDHAVLEAATSPVAVAFGAMAWVALATRTGLPVSTTHALAGAIIGVALTSHGTAAVQWPTLATTVALPLALSPFLSAAIAYVLSLLVAVPLQRASQICVCMSEQRLVVTSPSGAPLMAAVAVVPAQFTVGDQRQCEQDRVSSLVPLTTLAHWVSAGLLSFARGLNDTPKIVGLGVLALPLIGQATPAFFVIVACSMAVGGYWSGRRVTETLAENTVRIDPTQGLIASSVAAALVLLASVIALPVSTTHVVGGAIVGAGLQQGRDEVHWSMLRTILLAWVVTLPAAAVFGACVFSVLG